MQPNSMHYWHLYLSGHRVHPPNYTSKYEPFMHFVFIDLLVIVTQDYFSYPFLFLLFEFLKCNRSPSSYIIDFVSPPVFPIKIVVLD